MQKNGDETQSIRVNKALSDSGLCSRREADMLISEGRVTIDGVIAQMGDRVFPFQTLKCNGRLVNKKEAPVYIALNKPSGIVSTTDPRDPMNIVDFIRHQKRIFPIGRLDKDSQGLIFLTSDGDIVNKILRAGNNHEKEYVVGVNRPITKDFIRRMGSGVPILGTRTKPCSVQYLGDRTFRIVLTQGMNRQIRRMCEYLGYEVTHLTRVRIMNITLGSLKTGHYRNLTEEEVSDILRMCQDSVGTEDASK